MPGWMWFWLAAFAGVACGGENGPQGGSDGAVAADAGPTDSGPADMAFDGSTDLGPDGSTDAAVDAGPDGGTMPNGGPDGGPPDAQAPLDIFVLTCRSDLQPVEGGGGTGGAVSDDLHVFAVEQEFPIRDATVVLEAGNGSATAETNGRGCVRFFASGLQGPYDVHVFAEGRPYASFLGQSTAQLTVSMEPIYGRASLLEATTQVTGEVTNLSIVGAITSTISRFGRARAISASPFNNQPSADLRPTGDLFTNQVLVDGETDLRDFALPVRRDVTEGILMEGGRLIQGFFEPSRFVPTHLGLRTGQTFDRSVLPDQDITLSVPLDTEARLAVPPAPAGLEQVQVFGILSPLGGGAFTYGFSDETGLVGGEARFPWPPLQGAWAGGSYGALLFFETPPGVAPNLESLSFTRGQTTPQFTLNPPPDLFEAPTLADRTLSLTTDETTDWLQLETFTGRTRVWRVVAAGASSLSEVQFPVLPSGFSDPLTGEIGLRSTWLGLDPGFDPNEYRLETLASHLENRVVRSVDRVQFATPDPNPFACPPDAPEAIQNGGVAGGAPTGTVLLHTVDQDTQLSSEFIPFVVVREGNTVAEGVTDRNGCAQISDPSLVGPYDVHIFPFNGIDYRSFVNVQGARLTVRLPDGRLDQEGPAWTAVLEGTLGGFSVLDDSEPGAAAIIRALPVHESFFVVDAPQPNRSELLLFASSGVVSQEFGWDFRDYRLEAVVDGLRAVVALGGSLDTGSNAVTTTHVGLSSPVSPAAGDRLTGVDVLELLPLDETLQLTVTGTPGFEEPDAGVQALVFLDGGGMISLPGSDQVQTQYLLNVPDLVGPFANARLGAYVFRVDGNEFTTAIAEGDGSSALELRLPPIPSDIARNDRTFTASLGAELSDRAELLVFVSSAGGFDLQWIVEVFDPGPQLSVTLPQVPTGRSDPLSNPVLLLMDGEGLVPGFDESDAPGFAGLMARRRWARGISETLP